MARHRQPSAIAELKGATRKHPERYRDRAPESGLPLGNAPGHMSTGARTCWSELSAMAPKGVLTGSDRIALEVVSNLLAQFRQAPTMFPAVRFRHLVGGLARLVITPADRQRIGVAKPHGDETFDEF